MSKILKINDILNKINSGYKDLYIKNTEIELLADYISEKIGRSIDNPYFNAEYFIEFVLKTEIRFFKLSMDKSILGMTILTEGSIETYDENDKIKYEELPVGTIVIDENACGQVKGRLLFTLSHEIGHFIFDLPRYQNNTSLIRNSNCCRIDETNSITETDRVSWEERRANYFASCISMPKSIFCEDLNNYLYNKFRIEKSIIPAYKKGPNLNYLEASERESTFLYLMLKYGVSREALMNRLLALGYLDKALYNDQRIRKDRQFNNL